MFNSLRFRLIVSYIAVIGFCLAIIAVSLAFLSRSNPLNRDLTLERLKLDLSNIQRLTQPDFKDGKQPEQVMADLHTRFDTDKTRVIFFTGVTRRIVADSGNALVNRELGQASLGVPLRTADGLLTGRLNAGDNQVWLYVARAGVGSRNVGIAVAQVQQTSGLNSPFYVRVLQQLALSGCLGGLLAILLALLISWSVSDPLRRLASAADAIAQGDYDHRVATQGPTEVQELAQNFNLMAEQVQASQQSQRDFLANVSHDLKTPLTSIQGFAQAIADGAAHDTASVRHSAGVIQAEAQRMSRMVTELLDLARIESGQIVMRNEAVYLAAVLRNCAGQLALHAQQAKIKLETQVPDDLPVITGDGDRLAQAVTNLLDNALKHTPEGGQVTLAARSLSGSSIVRRGKAWPAGVEIAVSDTGSGIPPQDLGRIFERFYQVDKSRPRGGGLGLGLAIVKQIVEAHHGAIRAESVVGLGSRFTVTLPLEATPDTMPVSPRRR